MDWHVEQSRPLLAGAEVGSECRGSIGAELQAPMRLAHEHRWLPACTDPMKGIVYRKRAKVHGEATNPVLPELRPSTEQVKALMPVPGERCRSGQASVGRRLNKPIVVDCDRKELICSVGRFSGDRPPGAVGTARRREGLGGSRRVGPVRVPAQPLPPLGRGSRLAQGAQVRTPRRHFATWLFARTNDIAL